MFRGSNVTAASVVPAPAAAMKDTAAASVQKTLAGAGGAPSLVLLWPGQAAEMLTGLAPQQLMAKFAFVHQAACQEQSLLHD